MIFNIFDVLVILGLMLVSLIGINIAFQSHRQYTKAVIFAETHLRLAEENKRAMSNITRDLKEIRRTFKEDIDMMEAQVIDTCKFNKNNCNMCGEGGECIFERIATKSQRKKVDK